MNLPTGLTIIDLDRVRLFLICAAAATAFLFGCAQQEPNRVSAEPPPPGVRSIFVTGHRYHTGIAVRASDVPRAAWPARTDFPDAEYLDLGWGARDYYPLDDPGVGPALRVLFTRSPSTINAMPVMRSLAGAFVDTEVIELRVSDDAFGRMVEFVRQSYELDSQGRAIVVSAGAQQQGRFYASPLTFHMLENCNVWVARALRSAGIPVRPATSVTAGLLLRQVRPLGVAAAVAGK